MARKKKSQTDKTDAPGSVADDVTPPSAEAQDTPETENAPLPDDASGIDTVEASDDPATPETPSDEAVEDPSGSGTDQPSYDAAEPDTVEASEDTEAPETPPDNTAEDAPEAEAPQEAGGEDTETHTEAEAAPDPDHETEPDTPLEETEEIPPDEPAPETAEGATPVVRTEQVTVRQGGFWSMLIGGIAAAGIGVAAAPYIHPYLVPYLPVKEPVAAPPDDGLVTRLDEQAQRISDLGARIDELPAPTGPGDEIAAPPDDGLSARLDEQAERISDLGARIDGLPAPTDPGDEIAGLKDEVGGLSEMLTDLTERVAKLEVEVSNLAVRPAPDTSATDAALDDLRDRLAAQGTEIEDLRATLEAEEQAARDSARATLQRAALTRVMTALDTGEDFSGALTDLRDTGIDVPDVLENTSKTGVPTHAQLAESFPDAARTALAATHATDTGGGASVGGFLRAQLGVRSLEPREGNDPDAILSRAEAALAGGRLGESLSEINTLPEDARAAMSDWAADAATRRDALAAAEALSAELN
ncbi:MAG: hypothetical protein U5K36_08800 [Roseovarius sp.]|nr:hypothetical protein [Roseovarius sp.]